MVYNVLLVEDDYNIRSVVSENLKEAGYIVIEAEDGEQAFDIISNNNDIDIYIFDIMLPSISGLELLKKVRLKNQVPVIMLTALEDEDIQIKSFDYLADDYVLKPFSPQLLVRRVRSLLRRVGKATDSIKVGHLELDLKSHELFEDGVKIELTLKEFEIIHTLMINSGSVMTRQQLLNLIWTYEYFGDEKIVNVHIKNIRKKLTHDPIVTVLGVGYKIEKE